MKNKKQYAVCSGEGEGQGTIETRYTTERGIKHILTAERCGGDRWARATEIMPGETAEDADGRGQVIG